MRREAHVPRGGPDGGDGGRGGSIYLRVDAGQTALHDFRYKHHFHATPGGRGERQKRHGKAGEDLYLAVPPGTAGMAPAIGLSYDSENTIDIGAQCAGNGTSGCISRSHLSVRVLSPPYSGASTRVPEL